VTKFAETAPQKERIEAMTTTATVEPALATMEPIHRERMNCNINQIQKCQSNAAMQ